MPTNLTNSTNRVIQPQESYAIVGACFDVYNEIGSGFTEPVYQECLEHEFRLREIPFAAQSPVVLNYKGIELNHHFRPDLICYGSIIVELKAVRTLLDEHRSQILNYLNATGYRLGLLVNFGSHGGSEHERFVL